MGSQISSSLCRDRLKQLGLIVRVSLMNRPPPYFPQNQLSPPDPKRYRRFKLLVGAAVVIGIFVLIGLGYGIYYLIRSLMAA